jgi:hypothetical protein
MTRARWRLPGANPSTPIDAAIGRQLSPLLAVLHDRGIVNEDALVTVLEALVRGEALTRDHLVQIFGPLPMYHVLTTKDERRSSSSD